MNYCVVPLLMIYFRYSDARVDIQYTVFRHISLVHWCVGSYRFPCTMIIGVFFGFLIDPLPCLLKYSSELSYSGVHLTTEQDTSSRKQYNKYLPFLWRLGAKNFFPMSARDRMIGKWNWLVNLYLPLLWRLGAENFFLMSARDRMIGKWNWLVNLYLPLLWRLGACEDLGQRTSFRCLQGIAW